MDAAAVFGSLSVGLAGLAMATRQDSAVSRLVEGWSVPGAESPSNECRRGPLEMIGATPLGRRLVRGERIAQTLILSGRSASPDRLAGLRIVMAASGGALGLVMGAPMAFAAIPILVAVGLQLPVIRLTRSARRRQRNIELRVPDFVEVLVATAEAGLAPTVALSRAPGVLHGPLAQEIDLVAAEIQLGVSWRVALEHLVSRTDVPSIRRLVVALTRSSRLGSSVRSTLREVAEDLRASRRLRAEELARRAPVKMLFPLVFLILPAFLLLTVGPAVLATVRSLQAGG